VEGELHRVEKMIIRQVMEVRVVEEVLGDLTKNNVEQRV
jgi:hypothetical protein